MKILHVTPTYLPATRYGGPIYSVHGLARAQAALGHDVGVACTSVDGSADSDVVHGTPTDLDGVSVRYYRSRYLRRTYYSPSMSKALPTLVSQADVVHLHSVFLWPTLCAARAAARCGTPYAVSPRGMLVSELIADRGQLRKKAWMALYERRTLEQAAFVHVTSDREAQAFRDLHLPAARLVKIHNGVEDQPGNAAEIVADLPKSFVLYLGRLSWKKRIDTLIRAMNETAEELHLVIAGPDDEGLWPRLQSLAIERGIEERVRWLGEVTPDQRWSLMKAAKCLALVSSNENFGNVVTEAMSVACPVVVSQQVGASEIVQAARSGAIVEADPLSVAKAINSISSDSRAACAYGKAGLTHVARNLSWESIAKRMCREYERIPQHTFTNADRDRSRRCR